MLFSRFKTSTRTAIIFTLFSSTLLVLFVAVLNIYYFYNWKNDERIETLEKIEKISTVVFSEASGALTNDERIDIFIKAVLTQSGMVETNGSGSFFSSEWVDKKTDIFGMYHSGENIYIRFVFPIPKIGTVWFPYDITEHVKEQVLLSEISLFLLVIFFIITTSVSFFFASYSLRPLSKIITYIRSFSVNAPMPAFPFAGKKDDEFMIVAETISDAFKKIQGQTEVLRQFSSDAAHEFKTPLMVMQSEIDYAIKSGDHKTGLENIREQIHIINVMIGTLLTITRIEKEVVHKEPVDISGLFEDIIEEEKQIFAKKDIRVIADIQTGIQLNSDASMLRIIISNILSNAFKYTDSGEIRIILDKKGFSIQDTGIGIDKKIIDKIWDRLYREDESRSLRNGHGLGLFLVKTIVEKLGYTIHVESEKGVGSTFMVRF